MENCAWHMPGTCMDEMHGILQIPSIMFWHLWDSFHARNMPVSDPGVIHSISYDRNRAWKLRMAYDPGMFQAHSMHFYKMWFPTKFFFKLWVLMLGICKIPCISSRHVPVMFHAFLPRHIPCIIQAYSMHYVSVRDCVLPQIRYYHSWSIVMSSDT